MEATNIYWEALATWLHAQGYTVSVVNPARIKGYAQATMQRTKTDKQDSAVIASFCASHRPRVWQPLTGEQQHLRALVRHREDLLQTRLQQHNRLRDTTDTLVRASLQVVVDAVESQIAAVEQQIKSHLAAHTKLHTNQQLLTTIVGIGMVTAATVLAECAEVEQYRSAKSAAADTGVTASEYQSGTSVRRRARMSKQGKASLRAALYWPYDHRDALLPGVQGVCCTTGRARQAEEGDNRRGDAQIDARYLWCAGSIRPLRSRQGARSIRRRNVISVRCAAPGFATTTGSAPDR